MEEKRELTLEEMEKVNGGYEIPNPYATPQGGCGYNKHHFTCRCGFQTSSPDEDALHVAQNPDHPFMRYQR